LNFPLANQAVYNNPGYKNVIYNSLVDGTVWYTVNSPAQLDQNDTDRLTDLVKTQQQASDRIMIYGRCEVLLGDMNYYMPGQQVSAILNRLTFETKFQPTIMSVTYKFPEQHVEIVLDNKRIPTLLKAKAITDADTLRQQKLGIGGVHPYGGAKQVPYLP